MRYFFRRMSIQKKLFLVVVGGFYLLFCIAGAIFLLYEVISSRNRLQTTVRSLAEILGPNCVATVECNTPVEAEELLSALRLDL